MSVGVPRNDDCADARPAKCLADFKTGASVDQAGRFIESVVAPAFCVQPATLKTKSRGPAGVAFARQVAVYLAHTRLGLSYTEAGAYFFRDRTTVAHACRVVEDKREDPRIDALLDCLERAIDVSRDFSAGRHGSP